ILVGNIVFVQPGTIAFAAAAYAVIGLFHYVYRSRILKITFDPKGAEAAGLRLKLWDFFFYVTFALVITLSVRMAGVLLVFSYLIVPAACSALFTTNLR